MNILKAIFAYVIAQLTFWLLAAYVGLTVAIAVHGFNFGYDFFFNLGGLL